MTKRLASLLLLFFAAYLGVTVVLASRLSLWVDEILELFGTRDQASLASLIRWIPINPGSAPLGYLTQRLALDLFGFSAFAARLPSIVWSLAACAGVLLIARQLRLRAAALAPVLFALLPLQFRYASEGRPYAQALALGIGATAAFLSLVSKPSLRISALYTLLLAAGIYTQPLAVFVGASHLAWCLCCLERPRRMAVFLRAAMANAVAVALFLPWLRFAGTRWGDSIVRSGYAFRPSWSVVAMILRELCGHYAITALVVAALIYTLREPAAGRGVRSFLWLSVLVPIAGALISDAWAHYFFATRQLIFALPGIALLAADAFGLLLLKRTSAGIVLLALLAGVLVVQDAKAFIRPREDWALAAHALEARAGPGGCILTTMWPLYRFFVPELYGRRCADDLSGAQQVILPVAPYTAESDLAEARKRLESHGFRPDPGAEDAGGTRIQIFRRRPGTQ